MTTTLGSLLKTAPPPFDPQILTGIVWANAITASTAVALTLGSPAYIRASIAAWANQDDDAHEPCSLTACRHPLHPGPCKGWKGTLHSVSPGTYKQIEQARVDKANARRVKRIADLRSQGQPIPRRLLEEIKPKAPPVHPAHNAQPVPLGQVNQKADLAGGQAHAAGQAVSKAAGVTVKTAPPLPLGPKKQKPTVAGRGPAFVITQPKVTDQYKLDKAAKITPQEWAGLSDADKKTIRDELAAIKVRGFGPQQRKSDELLAKLPAPSAVGQTLKPGTPGTITTPSGKVHQAVSATPGKVSLGQAAKTATPQLPAPAPSPKRGTSDQNGILNKPLPGGSVTSTSVGLPSGYRITRDGMGYSLKHNGKLIRTSSTQGALEKYAHEHARGASGMPSAPTPAAPASPPVPAVLPAHAQAARAVAARTFGGAPTAKTHLAAYGKLSKDDFDHLDAKTQKTIRDDLANAKAKFLDPKKRQAAADLLDRFGSRHPAPAAAPATPATPAPSPPGGRKTFTATYNGKTVTRTSTQPYTHASVVRWSDGTEEVASFHNSEAAALKGVLTAQQKAKGAQVIKAVKVTPDTPNAPATPGGAKGYSDPMNEAVKAAKAEPDHGIALKQIGALSHDSIADLTPADRAAISDRLAKIAGPGGLPSDAKRAATLKRIIESGSAAQTSRKWDHVPSVAELAAEEHKTGVAQTALKTAAALKAADAKSTLTPGTTRHDRVKDLGALSKAEFDALKPDEQRKITDALLELHSRERDANGMIVLDKTAEKAVTEYTGVHPGLLWLRQAEADFRAGKIDSEGLWTQLLHARVAAPSKYGDPNSPGAVLEKEARRVAEDNPKLEVWLRASMIDNPYGGSTYSSISQAENKYNYVPAPRLSSSNISDIFRATEAELASSHPIHREAVKALRIHILETGLAPGTPWSPATKNHVVDNLLHISGGDVEIPPDRLKEFEGLPLSVQVKVRRVMRTKLEDQSNVHAKVGTYIALRELDGTGKASPDVHAALLAASNSFSGSNDIDVFRKLTPADYSALPSYAQAAIGEHLNTRQVREERGGALRTWTPQDNALKVFPAALAAHLNGTRDAHSDRRLRNAADIVNYGTKIINPHDRNRAYADVPIGRFLSDLLPSDQAKIHVDLDAIAADTALPLKVRFDAQMTRDVRLDTTRNLSLAQLTAIGTVDPSFGSTDIEVEGALNQLDKAEFDSLARPFREAVDERVKALTGPSQQLFTAKFHPAAPSAPAATPAGYTPTVQTNVPPHVQAALDTIYGVHPSGKSHTMAHQLSTYGALRGSDFGQLNAQEQGHLLGDLSYIATTAKGPSADKARKLIDRFTPAGTPSGQVPTGAVIPPANAVPGQTRYATPLKGLEQAKDSGTSGDGWISLPGGGRVWGAHGAAGLLLQHVDPQTGEKRYLMVQRGPAISDPGKWTFPGGASDSKETPHQGAARETIEELGLKKDALKDALVHGDHTFSVPNSTWKYTTVAAQVPTMIKPDLSTAHARAETSDAKWMTIDEIRALDKSGKLHGPIAGGKLEQNVISLYPQGTGQTLGQVARPGPVTRRLGRLPLPSGGRQAPATFNAWPHPHKQSKGRNLVSDKTNIDKLRQDVKQARKQYDGKTADGRLAAIGNIQGFDDTPTVASRKEIDRLLATGDYIEVWRGVKGGGSYRSGGKSAAQINEEMRSGPAYYGRGIFGNGYYLATQKSVASQYADNTKNSIARILIPKSAITEHYDKVEREAHAASSRSSKAKGNTYEEGTLYDPGRWAAAKGIDGIEIQSHHTSGGGWARHVAKPGQPAFNWLNRSVLIIQEAQ